VRATCAGLLLLLAACSSPPPPKDDTALLARLAAIDERIESQEKARDALLLRIGALERARPPDAHPSIDLAAGIASLESRTSSLDDRLAVLEAARNAPPPPPPAAEEKATIVDRKKEAAPPPAPNEPVRPLAAIDGETFSFVHEGAIDLARLVGVETPVKDEDDVRKLRAIEAWGEHFDFDAGAARARARLEELLTQGELSFTFPEGASNARRGLLVYARVKTADGSPLSVNETLLREGLALARGEHPQRSAFEKLEAEAREKKKGFFAP